MVFIFARKIRFNSAYSYAFNVWQTRSCAINSAATVAAECSDLITCCFKFIYKLVTFEHELIVI